MDLRAYKPADRDGCLGVFDSNIPESFDSAQRAAFAAFLASPGGSYFVLDHDGAIAACGGYALENPDLASVTWLMVRRDLHRNGLGRFLLFSAMRKLSAEADPTILRLETTASAAPFFEKQGFRTTEQAGEKIEMRKKLKVCQ